MKAHVMKAHVNRRDVTPSSVLFTTLPLYHVLAVRITRVPGYQDTYAKGLHFTQRTWIQEVQEGEDATFRGG